MKSVQIYKAGHYNILSNALTDSTKRSDSNRGLEAPNMYETHTQQSKQAKKCIQAVGSETTMKTIRVLDGRQSASIKAS